MSRPRSAPDLHLLGKVSTLYYLQNLSQQDIADRLRISRATVSRQLQEARAQSIVQITVNQPRGLHIDIESQLEEQFGLTEVQVIDSARDRPETLRHRIGAAAAAYLSRTLQPGERIGLAWGTTLSAMVHAMASRPSRDVRVVQTLGGIGPPHLEAYAGELVRRLAQVLGASPVLLPAPGVVATSAIREVLGKDRHIRMALAHFDRLDAVFVGIGSLRSNSMLNDGQSLPPDTLRELQAAGAVGDIALRFFDANGAAVRTSLDDRVLGITVEQLRKAKRVIAIAGGPNKVDAIFAALKAKVPNVLITDRQTAEALAKHVPAISPKPRRGHHK